MRPYIGWTICVVGALGAGPVLAGPVSDAPNGGAAASSGPVLTTPASAATPAPAPASPGPTPTASASTGPARNANVYNGTAHEPAAGPTTQREQASGIAGSEETQRRENETVEQLGQQAEHNAAKPGPSTGARNCSPGVTYCPP